MNVYPNQLIRFTFGAAGASPPPSLTVYKDADIAKVYDANGVLIPVPVTLTSLGGGVFAAEFTTPIAMPIPRPSPPAPQYLEIGQTIRVIAAYTAYGQARRDVVFAGSYDWVTNPKSGLIASDVFAFKSQDFSNDPRFGLPFFGLANVQQDIGFVLGSKDPNQNQQGPNNQVQAATPTSVTIQMSDAPLVGCAGHLLRLWNQATGQIAWGRITAVTDNDAVNETVGTYTPTVTCSGGFSLPIDPVGGNWFLLDTWAMP